jgi:curved DNA-binding protein CbpA
MEKTDCFYILQVSPGATLRETRKAYMRLVKRWHPDRFADNPQMRESAQEKLKIINSAYEEAKAAILARTESESRRGVAKPPPVSSERSPDSRHADIHEFSRPGSLFSVFRNHISNRIKRFFSSEPTEGSRRAQPGKSRPKPARPPDGKEEVKDFQKIFDDAVRKRTGTPYRSLKRGKRPVERSGKDPKRAAQNAASPLIRSRRKPGDRVEPVDPIGKIKGL